MAVRILISPAKRMETDTDSLPWRDLPAFLPEAEQLLARLREHTDRELQALWRCNDAIAAQNISRVRTMDLRRSLTPALLSYRGIQYQYMAPGVFSDGEWDYVQAHLRILSGFYGLLRPLDGVVPYRLEMQARLAGPDWKDLYGFWGKKLAQALAAETEVVVDLASREYSRAVLPGLPPGVRVVTCVFGRLQAGRVAERGTACTMARGEMVRWMAEHRITDAEALASFDRLGYRFDPARSGPARYVFLQEEGGGTDGAF